MVSKNLDSEVIKMKEFEFSSLGGGTLHGYRWEPAGEPVAVVQIIHGIAEHMLRYDEFARFLNAHGVLVVAEDHMGHGKSEGTRLYFSGGWETAAEDCYTLLTRTHEEFPQLPYFLFGHSMGSFLTRTILIRHPDAPLAGAVICGTGWQPAAVLAAGRSLCAEEKLRVGETGHSKILTSLMFGAYNNKFKPVRTPNDWICTDPEVVDRYTADPLCGGDATVGLARELIRGIGFIQKRSNLEKMNPKLPVFFIAGQSDPVGSMGEGVKKTARHFREAGMEKIYLHLYPGRHEILNEPNRADVFVDIWKFLSKSMK